MKNSRKTSNGHTPDSGLSGEKSSGSVTATAVWPESDIMLDKEEDNQVRIERYKFRAYRGELTAEPAQDL